MKLENREQALAFLIFLKMEELRHKEDIVKIQESWNRVIVDYPVSEEEEFEIQEKARDMWVDLE